MSPGGAERGQTVSARRSFLLSTVAGSATKSARRLIGRAADDGVVTAAVVVVVVDIVLVDVEADGPREQPPRRAVRERLADHVDERLAEVVREVRDGAAEREDLLAARRHLVALVALVVTLCIRALGVLS